MADMGEEIGDSGWYAACDYTVVRWYNNGCDWVQKQPLLGTTLVSGGAAMGVVPAQKWPMRKRVVVLIKWRVSCAWPVTTLLLSGMGLKWPKGKGGWQCS